MDSLLYYGDLNLFGLKKGGMPPRNKKNFRPTESGAGMTEAGVKAYRRKNPGSKLKKAVKLQNAESLFVHEVQDRRVCIILIVKKRLTKEFVRQEGDGNVRSNQKSYR